MMRFHTYTNECGEDLQSTYNRINNGLGVQTIYIDLLSLVGEDYRNKSQIMESYSDRGYDMNSRVFLNYWDRALVFKVLKDSTIESVTPKTQ